jgi:hypothetical protein
MSAVPFLSRRDLLWFDIVRVRNCKICLRLVGRLVLQFTALSSSLRARD